MRNRIMYVIVTSLVLALALTGVGCSKGARVAATVNGEEILSSAVDAEFARAEMANPGIYDGDEGKAQREADRQLVIDYLIDKELRRQAIEAAGIEITDQEVDETIEFERSMYQSDEEWNAALKNSGFETDKQIKDYIRESLGFQELAQQVATEALNAQPSEAEIQAFYDGNRMMFETGPERHGRHILVDDEETAQAAIARIQGGEDFTVVADELTTDPGSKGQGGDLGWSDGNDFVEGFREAYQTLPLGELSEPIPTSFGFHIIQIVEEREGTLAPLAEVRDSIAEDLRNSAANALVQEFLDDLKATAAIVVYDTDGNEIPYPFENAVVDPAAIDPTQLETEPTE